MICLKCGTEIKDGAKFCSKCGTSQVQDENVDEQIIIQHQQKKENAQLKDNSNKGKFINKKRWVICIVTTIILILVCGGFISVKFIIGAEEIKENINLGNKYFQDGKYEEAILAFQKVIQIEPKNIEVRVELAKVYIKTGKADEAEKILKESISTNPRKVEPYLELAKLYISENSPANAINILTDGYKSTNDENIKSMLEDLKSKIFISDINKTITLGESYSLPNKVTVMINNVSAQYPVKWDTTVVDTNKVGTSTFNGTLENTDKVVKVTLNVVTIASIGNINYTINLNDKYSLPSKVTAKMTDGSTREIDVTWNPSSVDTSKPGNYSYEGTVNEYNRKVKLTLNINGKTIITKEQAYKIFKEKLISTKQLPQGYDLYYYCNQVINGTTTYGFILQDDHVALEDLYCIDIYGEKMYKLSPDAHLPVVEIK